tara:strand:+ start:2250 stop:2813 length:564 start_codon:yes stop_codon:yes gene_type:complete
VIKVAIIDNYDSFTYNLVHYIEPMVDELYVFRNDEIDWEALTNVSHILLSPGPGIPEDSNDLMNVIDKFHITHNILGVCLGHQALAVYFGMQLSNLNRVKHGVTSKINILNNDVLFRNLPINFNIGHYHSWGVGPVEPPLIPTALNEEGLLMAFRHEKLKLFGIQFHPESILTEHGKLILKNWLFIC